jgi:hypothetical protein
MIECPVNSEEFVSLLRVGPRTLRIKPRPWAAAACKQFIFDPSRKPERPIGLRCAFIGFINALDRPLATTTLRASEKSAFLARVRKIGQ